MSKYTTGEIARLSGVSVRTVQYYDDRGLLAPSELSEGGRRLYNDEDLEKMHIICFLRDAGISINGISMLFREEKPENIIRILLDRQQDALRAEISECQSKLDLINDIRSQVNAIKDFSVESITDIAHVMKEKSKLKKMRCFMIASGVPVTLLQWTAIIMCIIGGYWWLFAAWAAVAIPWGIFVSAYYFGRVKYICPECHEVFKPKFKEAFFAYHTPKMRRLVCPRCSKKSLCVEIYSNEEKKNGI